MKPSYRQAHVRDLMEQWLDRAERCLQHFPLLRSFYNGVLICRLGITSPPLLLLLLLAALMAQLLAVGMVGAAAEWWAGAGGPRLTAALGKDALAGPPGDRFPDGAGLAPPPCDPLPAAAA